MTKLKIVRARDRSDEIQVTPKEALLEAVECADNYETVLILAQRKDETTDCWQGGGISNERKLRIMEKVKMGILE